MPTLNVRIEHWPFKTPFRISGYVFTEAEVVVVELSRKGVTGSGEATGVYYRKETRPLLVSQIEAVRDDVERGISRGELRELMPAGGARNALDCALWDLEAKETGMSAWQTAGVGNIRPLRTTYTVGAGSPEEMAVLARSYASAPRLKVKLTGQDDAPRIRAIRAMRPEAWIGVDANQGFTRASLEKILPVLVEADVSLIEQPLAVGHEAELEGLRSPIPLAADESLQTLKDIPKLKGRFDVANIKLDKCGGLTEALLMVSAIRDAGLRPMVGCMEGTSLAMMPGCVVGQLCEIVDIDAPLILAKDRRPSVTYRDGEVTCPSDGWGSAYKVGSGVRAAVG